MASAGTFETLLAEVGKMLLPLRQAVSSREQFFAFMLKLGWQADDIPQPLQDLSLGLDALFNDLRKIVGGGLAFDGSVSLSGSSAQASISPDDVLRVKQSVERVVNGIRAIADAPDAAIPAPLLADDFKTVFPKQLLDHLFISYLTTHQAPWAFAFRALGVIKTEYVPATGNRLPHIHYSLDFSDLPTVLGNPGLVLTNAFGWGTDQFDHRLFFSQLDNLLTTIGVDVFVEELRRDVAAKIEGGDGLPGDPVRKVIKAVIFRRSRPAGRMSADIRLLYLPKKGALKPGFALMPAFNGLLDFKMQLGPDVAVILESNLDLQGGVALLVRPGEPIDMVVGFNGAGTPSTATGSAEVRVERSRLDNAPILLLGSADGTRLQYLKLGGVGGFSLDAQNTLDVFAELEAKGLEFIFKPDEADGFIAKIFPAGGLKLGFDLAVGISHRRGFYFRGTSNLEIAIPTHVQLGPLDLQGLTIAANPQAGKLPIALGATVKAELGPLTAVVENIGLTGTFSFPQQGGNLGPLDLALAFKPPNGVGLSVDAGVVKGGGYLSFDVDKEEYAGALELVFSGFITLKAVGLITTRMPDGSKGFSLLIIITAEFGTGIQLGFGFTLLGVGGLVGLNRTVRLQPLMEGVRTGAVNSIMFPQDVIANAPRIISDLRAIFPPEEGRFLIGPMAKLGWGTPPLMTIALGVIIEIPGNIAIVGVLRVALPDADAALLILQVNFAGAVEFDKKRFYFFAALFESRVLFMTIEGEMGVLAAFGDDANFVVSVGGFHPRFNPPPLPFPAPRRVSVNVANSPVMRIRVEGYFAVTTNSAQFGARAELVYGADDFGVQGHIAFDALFQFSPFYFIIEISASVSLKVFGMGLLSIRLRFSLEGPTPWRARGEGSISFLFFSISADFDVTWGETRNTTLPPIAVMPLLKAELEKPGNWRALPPASSNLLVSLRQTEAAPEDLVLHPVGALRLSQKAVPLDLTIDKVGNQKPSDAKRFTLKVVGGDLSKTKDALESFAPAQFQNMDNAAKLSRPAFEPMHGGVELSVPGKGVASGKAVKRTVRYEEVIIDNNFKRFRRRFKLLLVSLFTHFLKGGAITQSALSKHYQQQLQPFEEKVKVGPEVYTVAFNSNNKAAGAAASFDSAAMAHEFMRQQVALDPNLADALHVIPQSEVNLAA